MSSWGANESFIIFVKSNGLLHSLLKPLYSFLSEQLLDLILLRSVEFVKLISNTSVLVSSIVFILLFLVLPFGRRSCFLSDELFFLELVLGFKILGAVHNTTLISSTFGNTFPFVSHSFSLPFIPLPHRLIIKL